MVVPVHLGGRGPYDFVLDTGATLSCVDVALADSLGLEEASGMFGRGLAIGQEASSMRLVQLDSMRVGGATATGLTACTVDLAAFRSAGVDVRGLVGLNFLRSFRVILDFEAETLVLERPESE